MKKHFFFKAMALLVVSTAVVGCGEKDLYDPVAAAQNRDLTYQNAFVQTFGQPSPNQTWGFDDEAAARTRSGNMEGVERVPETSTGINANANEWADTLNAPHNHGGWLVPDALTPEQKAIVAQYFQTHPNLTYDDPQWTNFFVQQVYSGGNNVKHGDTTEGVVDANGNTYGSGTMNQLTVGYNHQHINNFNAGSYSGKGMNTYEGAVNEDGTVNVLDNGYTVNDFATRHHPDQIMLMVNIDDTGCMGYFSSGASVQRDDKAALVDWQTIADWANSIGLNGNCLNDGWNRSFVGFDLALKNLQEAYTGSYAKFSDGQFKNPEYVWDGTTVLTKGDAGQPDYDLTSLFTSTGDGYVAEILNSIDFTPYKSLVVEFSSATTSTTNIKIEIGSNEWGYSVWGTNNYSEEAGVTEVEYDFASHYLSNLNMILKVFVSGGDATISKIYLRGKEGTSGDYTSNYLLVNGKEVPFLDTNANMYSGKKVTITDDDMKIEKDGKLCFNMKKIADLVGEGYLPIQNKDLREWVKFEYGDGYFSDWIVTLTKAQRQGNDPNPIVKSGRIMAEDLGTIGDFDFNDVVFDAFIHQDGTTEITVLAAGGTMELSVAGKEVHELFGVAQKDMVNTGLNGKGYVTFTADEKYTNLIDIPIVVKGTDEAGAITYYTLTAVRGAAPQKICVPVGTAWADEYVSIEKVYPGFRNWVQGQDASTWTRNPVQQYIDRNLSNNEE